MEPNGYQFPQIVISSGEKAGLVGWGARSKHTPRTDLSISDEMVPSTKPWMALPSGCIAGSLEFRQFTLAGRRA